MKARFLMFKIMMVCMVGLSMALFSSMGEVQAAQSEWVAADYMKARLIAADSDTDGEAQGGVDLAVQLQVDEGWHTYWRSPGEAGLPLRFDWTGSQNMSDFAVSWPVPRRFDEFGMQTFGYKGNVVLPVSFAREDVQGKLSVVLNLNAMVCKDICIPQSFLLKLDIAAGKVGRSNAALIDFGQRKVPVVGALEGVEIASIVVGPEALVVNAVIADFDAGQLDLFVELDAGFASVEAFEVNEGADGQVMIRVPKPDDIDDLSVYLAGKMSRATLLYAKRAIEQEISF